MERTSAQGCASQASVSTHCPKGDHEPVAIHVVLATPSKEWPSAHTRLQVVLKRSSQAPVTITCGLLVTAPQLRPSGGGGGGLSGIVGTYGIEFIEKMD